MEYMCLMQGQYQAVSMYTVLDTLTDRLAKFAQQRRAHDFTGGQHGVLDASSTMLGLITLHGKDLKGTKFHVDWTSENLALAGDAWMTAHDCAW